MQLTPYRDVLVDPAVRRLLILGVFARLPATSGLLLTLYIVQTLERGYAAAGLAATAFTVGAAIGAPWRGRAVDRVGLRRALVPSILGESLCLGLLAFSGYRLVLPLAFAAGVLMLPTFSVIRQSLSVLVADQRRRTAFSLDSMGVELTFIIGPLLGVAVATATSPRVALVGVALLVVASGLLLFALDPPVRSANPVEAVPGSTAVGRSHWRSADLLVVLAATTGATVTLFGSEVALVALLRTIDRVSSTGVVFAFWGTGSILGAFVYGLMAKPPHPLWLLFGLGLLTMPLGLANSVAMAAALVLVAGAACAPVIAGTAELVTRLVPEHSRGAALGWHGAALTTGGAVGAPLAGAAIDLSGPGAGFLVVAGVGVAVAGVGLVVRSVRTRGG